MFRENLLLALGIATLLLTEARGVASDHADGAAVLTDPSTDLGDVYAWMDPAGDAINLAMTVHPAAAKTTLFSDQAYYVFHTTSRSSALVTPRHAVDITCGFDTSTPQNISCWVGDNSHYLYGDASSTTALLANQSGTIKVFAGPRKDHFFFNLDGFNRACSIIRQSAATLTVNANGCWTGPPATLAMAKLALAQNQSGSAPAVDPFLPLNILAIVMKVPLALINQGGPILGVSAATYRKG